MGKRHRDDSVSSSAEEEGDADDDRHHRHKSSSRHHKKHSRKKESSSSSRKHKKKRKSRDYDKDERSSMSYSHSYSDDTSAPSFSSEDDNDRRRRRDKKKKESKKDKKRRKHHKKDKKKKDKKRSRHNSTEKTEEEPVTLERQDHVAQALTELFTFKPIMASELPIMLIRLAGGASFDLRQMTDAIAAQGLEKVLTTLQSFGVQKHPETKMWYFQPPASAPGKNRDELVLLRVIRALLNDAGVTMEDIEQFEVEEEAKQKEISEQKALQEQEQAAKKESGTTLEPELAKEVELVKDKTRGMLLEFAKKDPQLGQQLGELCKTIVEGESISIDGIPDESLKVALESIFVACGLEKSEIIDDDEDEDGDSDDDESNSGPVMGYGLPDDENNSSAQIKLAGIMEACRTAASEGGTKKRVLGPARGPLTQAQMEASNLYPEVESEDDEGPAPIGAARRRGPAPSKDDVAAEARYRELQLKATAQGVDMPAADGAREEWMLLPGEHDFLSSIVSGQTIKSRGFQNKKARGVDDKEQPIHPAVQAEMDAIMQAHADLRGPSLIEQHREKVRKDKEEKAKQKGKQWTWNRESDLDAGRRVDKDALHQVLGGAAENLKSKFQGGFH